jgi:hypothetical protein
MSPPGTTDQKQGSFLKRIQRLIGLAKSKPSRDELDSEALAIEREFLSDRRARLERELERRLDQMEYRYKDKREAIARYARDPLPDAWTDGGVPLSITSAIRPLRRELEVLRVLESAIMRRPLVDVIEGALRRVEEELAESLRQARPAELYGEDYWTDEALEQTLSHLLHLWAEWLNHPTGARNTR